MRSIYLRQAFASEAVFMHLLFAPFCQNLSKPRNLSYFPLKIRSRPKKGENRPRFTVRTGPSALIPGSQKSPGSEKTPPRRQPEKSVRNGTSLLELRPSKNTVTPVLHPLDFFDFLVRSYKNVSVPSNNSQLFSVWPRSLRPAWL